MKKVAIASIVFLGFATASFAQTEKNETGNYKLVPIEKTTPPGVNSMSPEEEIAFCTNQINAIDTKESWIRQNPEELKIANENGWFAQADKNRAELKARIAELKK